MKIKIIGSTHTIVSGMPALLQLLLVSFVFTGMRSVYGSESVLLFRTAGPAFEDAAHSMSMELKTEIPVKEVIVNKETTHKMVSAKITELQPSIIVLMSNSAINLYKEYQRTVPDSISPIPSVALMSTLVDISIKEIGNICGIAYEVPIVTCLINVRRIAKNPIKKVGVIYREFLTGYMTINTKYCLQEGFEIVTHMVPNFPSDPAKECRKGLKKLLKTEKVDAIWVYNDNILLKPDALLNAWIPAVKKYKKPMVVGLEPLADPKLNFGIVGVLPDHKGLGYQAANLVLEIMDNDWHVDNQKVQPPISIYMIINKPMAEKFWSLTEDDFLTVDKVLK